MGHWFPPSCKQPFQPPVSVVHEEPDLPRHASGVATSFWQLQAHGFRNRGSVSISLKPMLKLS